MAPAPYNIQLREGDVINFDKFTFSHVDRTTGVTHLKESLDDCYYIFLNICTNGLYDFSLCHDDYRDEHFESYDDAMERWNQIAEEEDG
jgi:hypothetical protein